MISVERELNRYLTLLRSKIPERGFTQMEVQDALGWGRSYISQLLTKQKALRLEQVLLILKVIGVEPRAFFAELHVGSPQPRFSKQQAVMSESELPPYGLAGVKAMTHGLRDVLLEKGLITAEGLKDAVKEAKRE